MSERETDWRLRGQERFLKGALLHRARYVRPRPDWDHDHCAFCWAKFMEEDLPGVLHCGYTTEDEYYWICEQCFNDFKALFQWTVAE
jgi:hypothetical protein